ncbi:MAG: ORF6N domain-containing protein [bacterium]
MTKVVAVKIGTIQQRILLVRGEKVIIDADLAEFYGVTTKALNQAVRRNRGRFPADFVFRLTRDEKSEVVTVCDHLSRLKYSPTSPYAFTEHGAIMAAAVLNSSRAVQVSVFIVRAFVALRQAISQHKELSQRMGRIERRLANHDSQIQLVVRAIRELSAPTVPSSKRPIGFHGKEP